jgi:hypothetical protein
MRAVDRLAMLSLLITAALTACRRNEPAPSVGPAVSPELRAMVGHELSLDLSRTDPDLSLVRLKPTITDVDVVALTIGLETAFRVDISPEASFEMLGARAHAAPLDLTLRNLARLVASAPRAQHPRPPPEPEDAGAADEAEAKFESPTLVRGAYVFTCPLPGLPSGRVRVDQKNQLALLSGRRTLDKVTLEGEFFGADARVQCADGYVTILRKQPSGRDRVLSYTWRAGHLDLNTKGDEVP